MSTMFLSAATFFTEQPFPCSSAWKDKKSLATLSTGTSSRIVLMPRPQHSSNNVTIPISSVTREHVPRTPETKVPVTGMHFISFLQTSFHIATDRKLV